MMWEKEKKYDIEKNLDVHKCNVTYFTTVFWNELIFLSGGFEEDAPSSNVWWCKQQVL